MKVFQRQKRKDAATQIISREVVEGFSKRPADLKAVEKAPQKKAKPRKTVEALPGDGKELNDGLIFLADGAISNYPAAERFRILRAHIERKNQKSRKYNVIAITSALPQEGKSVVSVNLSRGLSVDPVGRTLLIDCDLRRGTVHEFFNMSQGPGLAEVLEHNFSLDFVIQKVSNGLDVLPAGENVMDPAAAIEGRKFASCLEELRNHYRYIVVDCPPALLCPEPIAISSITDTTLMVIRAWKTNKRLVQEAVEIIGKNRILGSVVNDGTDSSKNYMYYDYYGYYNHKNKRKKRPTGTPEKKS